MHMCVSLLLSDVDRRLNREIGGDGVISPTTHLGLHDNSCFEEKKIVRRREIGKAFTPTSCWLAARI